MILFSMAYRGRGYADGYRLFPNEESFLSFVQEVLDEARKHKSIFDASRESKRFDCIESSGYEGYNMFEVTETGSISIGKRIKPIVRTMVKNMVGHLPAY